MMRITENAYKKIMSSFPVAPPENGGILGSRRNIVCEYVHDYGRQPKDVAIYVPNTEFLNSCIKEWKMQSIEFVGLVHSHPRNEEALSSGDLAYIREILNTQTKANKKLFFPIITSSLDMIVYAARKKDDNVVIAKEKIMII